MATKTIIGIDTHISSCNYLAMEEKTDVILGADYFSTNTTNFIRSVSKFPKPRVVIIEQGPLANWIERLLEPHVEKVVIADTKQNNWISKDPNKNDKVDAEKLVRLYKGSFIKEIKSRSRDKAELISLVIQYHSLTKQQTRIKLQIGAKFRQGGKRKRGEKGYRDESISMDLIYLSHNKAMQKAVLQYKDQLRLIERQIKKIKIEMQKFSKKFPEIEFLRKFSGIGFVGSFTLSALIDIPERFSTVKKIWIYCGYGLDRQSSGGKSGPPKITKRSNRMLKDVIMTAVHNIINLSKDSKYKTWFLEELDKGKNQKKVKARLARKLIKDIWLEWRSFNDLKMKHI